MKKIIKSLLAIIVTVISVIAPVAVYAAAPSSITVNTTTPQPGISWYIPGLEVGTKSVVGGGVGYCLNYHLNTPVSTTVTRLNKMDVGMTYIIENGYPNKSITGDNAKDYYITQVAIWSYLDQTSNNAEKNLSGVTLSDNYQVVPYIKNLVNGALAARNTGIVYPDINAVVNNNSLVMNNEQTYFISEDITINTVKLVNYNAELVNAPEGSYITDVNGNKKTTFNAGEKFRVYVPVNNANRNNTSFEVKLSGSNNINSVYEYFRQNEGEQNIVTGTLYPENYEVVKNINLNVEYPVIEVPDTNSSASMMIIFGSLLTMIGSLFIKKYAKQK